MSVPPQVSEQECSLLARALREGLPAPKRTKRTRAELRKVSDHVERTWVRAGPTGEAVRWRARGS